MMRKWMITFIYYYKQEYANTGYYIILSEINQPLAIIIVNIIWAIPNEDQPKGITTNGRTEYKRPTTNSNYQK